MGLMSGTDLKYCCVMALSLAGDEVGYGVTGEKAPVWTALRVNIFAPTFTKDLTKRERERREGCQWTTAEEFA